MDDFQKFIIHPTGEVIAQVPLATKEEVKQAIQLAKAAFPGWKKTAIGKTSRGFTSLPSIID
ncbi:aldehyde dehydrogenase family protein [Lysinibacillus pakistanensis]|uniref:aldehyde dehydrogenase family protein n=1 Tax=Lysinibacillus pakistanensis TaxID=759811 RepID=UPI003D2AE4BD